MSGSSTNAISKQIAGFLIVALSMYEMFTIPRDFFVLGSLVSTSIMVCVAFVLTGMRGFFRPRIKLILLAIVGAIGLYLVFYAGNLAIKDLQIPGLSASGEQNIYSLFQGVPTLLLVVVLILDSVGFETYFRANLMGALSKKIGSVSIPVVSGIDAAIHFATLNPLFPATTFVADLLWGSYFYKTRDLSTTILCHLVWDILIFVLIPIR